MALVSVTDHIKPIREAETPREEEEAIEGVVEVARQLREAKKKKVGRSEFETFCLGASVVFSGEISVLVCVVSAKDEPLDLKVLELPEAPSEPSSPSSEDEEDHGLFHSEVQWPTADMSPLREAAHPVSIEGASPSCAATEALLSLFHFAFSPFADVTPPPCGLCVLAGEFAVDCVLGFRDLSPFAAQFPVYKIEWCVRRRFSAREERPPRCCRQAAIVWTLFRVESLNLGDSRVFSVVPLAAGGPDTPLKLSNELLGKIVAVKAYRRVEDQVRGPGLLQRGERLSRRKRKRGNSHLCSLRILWFSMRGSLLQLAASKLAALEGGAYDQHTGIISPGGAKALPAFVEVVSRAAGGPVLLSAAEASACLKAFARGGFSCAVLLRDILDEVGNQPHTQRGASPERAAAISSQTLQIPECLRACLKLSFRENGPSLSKPLSRPPPPQRKFLRL